MSRPPRDCRACQGLCFTERGYADEGSLVREECGLCDGKGVAYCDATGCNRVAVGYLPDVDGFACELHDEEAAT